MKIEIFRVTGLEYKFRHEPGSNIIPEDDIRTLIITNRDGEKLELKMYSDPDSTPVWPQEKQS